MPVMNLRPQAEPYWFSAPVPGTVTEENSFVAVNQRDKEGYAGQKVSFSGEVLLFKVEIKNNPKNIFFLRKKILKEH